MRSKSLPRSASSSFRFPIDAPMRVWSLPSATDSNAVRSPRIGLAKYQASRAAKNRLTTLPESIGMSGIAG